MREHDAVAVSAVRAALAAVDNAAAPELDPADLRGTSIEQSATGVGVRELDRLPLSDDDVRRIVAGEIEDRLAAAATYDAVTGSDRADDLRRGAAVLREVLQTT
jgi:uncharacterized protein YqeY